MEWGYRVYTATRWLIALSLVVCGIVVWVESDDLMKWLISKVGEERALGPENVIRLEDGKTLLTNPGAMIRWTIPFWGLGFVMVAGGVMLMFPWMRPRMQ